MFLEKQNQATFRVRAYSVTEMPSLDDDQSFWSFINKVYILSLFLGHPCKYETSYWRKNVKSEKREDFKLRILNCFKQFHND